MVNLKRRIYKRGSSYEITIPMPLLFKLDKSRRHAVVFKLDEAKNKWYVELEEALD